METKKEMYSLNDELLNNLSIEELEERLELACWNNCNNFTCGYTFTCDYTDTTPPDQA